MRRMEKIQSIQSRGSRTWMMKEHYIISNEQQSGNWRIRDKGLEIECNNDVQV